MRTTRFGRGGEGVREETGLDDLGDIPYREPLEVLLASLNRFDAGLDEPRLAAAGDSITGLLVKRLRLVDDRTTYPAISDEKIVAPLFIVGLPRTGSTHLHALLAEVDGIGVPWMREMTSPSPPPEEETYTTDPRIVQFEAAVAATPPEMMKRHPVSATRQQCDAAQRLELRGPGPHHPLQHPPPTVIGYQNRLRGRLRGPPAAFAAVAVAGTGGGVGVRYPERLPTGQARPSARGDPDARIWGPRPAVVVPSVASLTGYIRGGRPASSTNDFGRESAARRSWSCYHELAVRRTGREPATVASTICTTRS